LIAHWYAGPLTLVHGDSHLGNLFELTGPDGVQMGMLDFQAVHWSKGMRDVQYHLINSLAPDVLAAHESDLIDHYVAALARNGVTLDPERARADYRAFSFQTLMTAAVSFAGGLTEREAVVRTVLERSTAAVERLRFGEWLDALPA
jgi:aminoglycoside/choline kinase family phosphotransferase